MIFERRWLLLLACGAIPLMLSGTSSLFLLVALVWFGALVAVAAVDGRSLPHASDLHIDREAEEKTVVGSETGVSVRIRNNSRRDLTLELKESPPKGIEADLPATPLRFAVKADTPHAVTYQLKPKLRGLYRFGDVWLRVQGRYGCVARIYSIGVPSQIKVYPNLAQSASFELMARKGRLQQAGIRAARLQGVGREFESLRDYQPDDEMRRIDWKATARRGKLVSRQYEIERSQSVLLVLDVGRTMLADVDGVPKLEYAINAALLLAFVATQSEDKVGLLVFSDRVHTYLPPKKGRGQVYAIMEALYNEKATLSEPDYRGALAYLQARWRKRSLLVCFTDLWDPESSRLTITELAALQPRHLACAVTLLDTKVMRAAEQEPEAIGNVYEKAVAMQSLSDRERALSALSQRGVLVVDSPAEKLSAELVNRYLEVKERMML